MEANPIGDKNHIQSVSSSHNVIKKRFRIDTYGQWEF